MSSEIRFLLPSKGRRKALKKQRGPFVVGVERRPGQKPPADEKANESALGLEEDLIELYPALSPEEERHLAHLTARSEKEKQRAQYLNENPDSRIVEEGKIAYFRLFMASQHLVLSITKEYVAPGKDMGKLLEAGNKGLMYAIHKFGMKVQVPFRAYAAHWIHLEIMESVIEWW